MKCMSKIEELEKELYTKSGEGEVEQRMRHRTFFPGTLRKFPSSWFGREASPEKEALKKKRSLLLTAAFFIVPFLVSIGGGSFSFYLPRDSGARGRGKSTCARYP